MFTNLVPRLRAACVAASLVGVSLNASAIEIDVFIDASGLGLSSASLVFDFADGDSTDSGNLFVPSALGNNTARISDFSPGTSLLGPVEEVDSTGNDVDGALPGVVTMHDADNVFLGEFATYAHGIDLTSPFSFRLSLTENLGSDGFPDVFSIFLLETTTDTIGDFTPVLTGLAPFDSVAEFVIGGTGAIDQSLYTCNNPSCDPVSVRTEVVSVPATRASEPAVVGLLALGLLGMFARTRRHNA